MSELEAYAAPCLAPRRFCVCARAACGGAAGAEALAAALLARPPSGPCVRAWLGAEAVGCEVMCSAEALASPNGLRAAEADAARQVRLAATACGVTLALPAPLPGGGGTEGSDDDDDDDDAVDELVDILLTAPVAVPTRRHAERDLRTTSGSGACKSLASAGVAALRCGGALRGSALFADAVAECERRVGAFEAAAREAGVALGEGDAAGFSEFTFSDVASRGGGRFDLLVDLDGSPAVERLARRGPWVGAVRDALSRSNEDIVFQCSIVESRPGATAQDWHADGPHVGKARDWDCGECDPAYALCAFVPLLVGAGSANGRGVGATQFWPGSHEYNALIGFGGAAGPLGCALELSVDVGDAVIYDYRCMHRGLSNTSEGLRRPLLQILYCRASYDEARNYNSDAPLLAPIKRRRATLDAGETETAYAADGDEPQCVPAAQLRAADDASAVLALAQHGAAVVAQTLPQAHVAALRELCDSAAAVVLGQESDHTQVATSAPWGAGGGVLSHCDGSIFSTQRDQGRYDVLLRDMAGDAFECVHRSAPWAGAVREALGGGEVKMLYAGMLYASPGAKGGKWHADGGELFGGAESVDMLPPHAVAAVVSLVDMTADLGPTEFRLRESGERVAPLLRAGDCLLFDYRTIHRATPNRSAMARPLAYYTFSRPWFVDTRNWSLDACRCFWDVLRAASDDGTTTGEVVRRRIDEAGAPAQRIERWLRALLGDVLPPDEPVFVTEEADLEVESMRTVVSVFLEARRGMVRLELATRLADVREQALLEAAKNAALCP